MIKFLVFIYSILIPVRMMKRTSIQIFDDNFTHIFYSDTEAILFDPAEPEIILSALSKKLEKEIYHKSEIKFLEDCSPRKILYSITTHSHWDHAAGNQEIMNFCSNVLIGNNKSGTSPVIHYTDVFNEGLLEDSDLKRNNIQIECIYTPCHTKDSYCFYINNDGVKYLITGDTIFWLGVGMFFEGNASDMVEIIENLKKKISDDTIVLYGHQYRERNLGFVETFWNVPEETKEKIFLSFKEEKEFNPFFNLGKVKIPGKSSEIMHILRESKTKFNKSK